MTNNEELEKSRAPLIEHLTELRDRLLKACYALIAGFAISYYFSSEIYEFLVQPLANSYPNPDSRRLIYTGLTEAFTTYIRLSLFSGFFIAFPVIAYQ
ncbi:MAG: twin-arginine translocase subunit TatC, partial [Pseudomonadota bacterium]